MRGDLRLAMMPYPHAIRQILIVPSWSTRIACRRDGHFFFANSIAALACHFLGCGKRKLSSTFMCNHGKPSYIEAPFPPLLRGGIGIPDSTAGFGLVAIDTTSPLVCALAISHLIRW